MGLLTRRRRGRLLALGEARPIARAPGRVVVRVGRLAVACGGEGDV